METKQTASDHLSNERTLLAWIRTGIGIMAFGFVVVKFSLFMKQISAAVGGAPTTHYGYSAPIGISLVILGALSLLLSLLRYQKTKRLLLTGNYRHTSGILYGMVALVLIMSVILVIYLIKTT